MAETCWKETSFTFWYGSEVLVREEEIHSVIEGSAEEWWLFERPWRILHLVNSLHGRKQSK